MKGSESGGGGCCSGRSKRSKSAGTDIHVNKQAGKNDIFNGSS